jgi:2-C-methyl-D-erythritol 4-phosphate cytidylyltransferase
MPKQFVSLLDRPVLAHTIRAFSDLPGCVQIIVAVEERWRSVAEECARELEIVWFIEGGAERQHSIANAIEAVRGEPELVLVHDAARPCVSRPLIERVIAAASEFGAAIPALPIAETVKRVNSDGVVTETIPRDELRAAQTPQGFRRDLLQSAYAHAAEHGLSATDDASLVEAYGAEVHVVEGDPANLKITYPSDLARAVEALGWKVEAEGKEAK